MKAESGRKRNLKKSITAAGGSRRESGQENRMKRKIAKNKTKQKKNVQKAFSGYCDANIAIYK